MGLFGFDAEATAPAGRSGRLGGGHLFIMGLGPDFPTVLS